MSLVELELLCGGHLRVFLQKVHILTEPVVPGNTDSPLPSLRDVAKG